MLTQIKSISISLAIVVTSVVSGFVIIARLAGLINGWPWIALLVIVFASVALASRQLVSRRVRVAITDLHKIERREFDQTTTDIPGKDVISELQTVISSAGKTLENEISAVRRIESYRRDFLGNVSHELKTPIFSIRGFAETLRDGALQKPGVREAFIERIIKNADRLSHLADDLTEISKIETGELKMESRAFSIGAVIQEVVESVEQRARNKEISIRTETAERLPFVFADDGRIRQVVSNLVDNGIKYTNPGGTVTIAATLEGSSVLVSISDDGIGIAPEHQARITERFYRVDESRSREQGGTGLGLAIVKHILNAHRQSLALESSLGGGSRFTFRLPTVSQ